MENLDFGWGLGLIVLAFIIVVYYAVSFLGFWVITNIVKKQKKYLDKWTRWSNRTEILYQSLHWLIAAFITFILFGVLFFLISLIGYRGSVFGEVIAFIAGIPLNIICALTCLGLTTREYNSDWEMTGKVQTKRLRWNVVLWSTFHLPLLIPLDFDVYILGSYKFIFIYLPLLLLMTYFFLKIRNRKIDNKI